MSIETLEHDIAGGIAETFGMTDNQRDWMYQFVKAQIKRSKQQPVSVSLEKCADAVGKAMGWNNMVTDANAPGVAKAVLNAAGVKYHE